MFNGLIREIGKIISFSNNILKISSSLHPKIGDSIAVNGACLTAINSTKKFFEVELSPETQQKIAIENYQPGKFVHLEEALKFGDKIDGHLIQGHIDAIGEILEIKKIQNSHFLVIKTDPNMMKFIAPKGSIAIDGVSLTINQTYRDRFSLTIIPHTFENTIFKYYRLHQRVNIETDMFARYIYNFLNPPKEQEIWW
jgi:riboflavin synthase